MARELAPDDHRYSNPSAYGVDEHAVSNLAYVLMDSGSLPNSASRVATSSSSVAPPSASRLSTSSSSIAPPPGTPQYVSIEENHPRSRAGTPPRPPMLGSLRGDLMSSQKKFFDMLEFQRRFEEAFYDVEDDLERSKQLRAVTGDFLRFASLYGQLIISEKDLPLNEKSIKPSNLGGVAGGSKFLVCGILFKFAEDPLLSNGSFLYGGNSPNEEAAQKAAGHERKSAQQILKRSSSNLTCPLFTIVDFRGSRLSAQSVVPVNFGRLVYGSRNGGRNIAHGDFPELEKLAASMGLAKHKVREGETGLSRTLSFPADIEVHQVGERLYILDTARLMPPFAPIANKRAIFFELMRPEFVSHYFSETGTLLSSDAFSSFADQTDATSHNSNVKIATEYMMHVRLPHVTQELDEMSSFGDLSRLLQFFGINVRFLGFVRFLSQNDALRLACLHEMMARCLKNLLKSQWRLEVRKLDETTLRVLQRLITSTQDHRWLKDLIAAKFGAHSLNQIEMQSATLTFDTRYVLERLGTLAGIDIGHKSIQTLELTESDIALKPRVKQMDFLVAVEAEALRIEAKSRSNLARKLVLLRRSQKILQSSLVADPRDQVLRARYVRVLLAIAFEDASMDLDDVEKECHTLQALYFRAKVLRLRFMRALQQHRLMDASLALSQALELFESSNETDASLSHLYDDEQCQRKWEKLKKLVRQDPYQLLSRIACSDDYNAAQNIAKFLDEDFYNHLASAKVHERPQLIGFGLLQEESICKKAVELWFSQQTHVSVNSLSFSAVTDSLLNRIPPLSHILHLSVENSLQLSDAALIHLLRSAPAVMEVSIGNRHALSEELILCLDRVEDLSFIDCGFVHEKVWALPHVKYLDLSGCVNLCPPPGQLPPLLERLVAIGSSFNLNFALPKSLTHIHVDGLTLHAQVPLLVSLRVAKVTRLLDLCKFCPALEELIVVASTLEDDDVAASLELLPRLIKIDMENPAQLTEKSFSHLHNLVSFRARSSVSGLGAMTFVARSAVQIELHELAPPSDLAWNRLESLTLSDFDWSSSASSCPSLAELSLINVSIEENELGSLLVGCPRLRLLSLDGIASRGTFLSQAATSIQHLVLRNTAWDASLVASALALFTLLQTLSLENCGVCPDTFLSLATKCRQLKRLRIASPCDAMVRDPDKWLSKMGSLEQLALEFCVPLTLDALLSISKLHHLRRLQLDSFLNMDDSCVAHIASCHTLDTLILLRSYVSVPQIQSLVGCPFKALYLSMKDVTDQSVIECLAQSFPLLQQASVSFGKTVIDVPNVKPFHVGSSDTLSIPSIGTIKRALLTPRTKCAFMVWSHDAFSVCAVVELLKAGYQVICGETSRQGLCQPLPEDVEDSLRQVLKDSGATVWTALDFDHLDPLKEYLKKEQLLFDLAVVLCPFQPHPQWQEGGSLAFHETSAEYWNWRMQFVFLKPLVLLSCLTPFLRKTVRVGLHGSMLASLSKNTTSGLYSLRAGHSALHAVLRCLAIDFGDKAVVVGISPGLWIPGAPLNLTTKLSEREAAIRFITALLAVEQKHSGRIVTHNLDIINE